MHHPRQLGFEAMIDLNVFDVEFVVVFNAQQLERYGLLAYILEFPAVVQSSLILLSQKEAWNIADRLVVKTIIPKRLMSFSELGAKAADETSHVALKSK
jgi:hypothetical protein